jgi:hypothetical protein
MNRISQWMILLLMIVVLGLAGCSQASGEKTEKSSPVMIEAVQETGLNRVVLTEKAAERLGIQTAQVRAEKNERQRIAWGEVLAASEGEVADPTKARIFVSLRDTDTAMLDRSQLARVMLLDDEDEDSLEAELDDDSELDDDDDQTGSLYYTVGNADQRLAPGQRVRVAIPMVGAGSDQTVVPYSAVIYDLDGATWVYISPEPLVFTRHPIVIDYIESDMAFLLEGPPVGAEVATVGVAELYGADTGVGK